VLTREIPERIPILWGLLGHRYVYHDQRIDLTVRDYAGSLMRGSRHNIYLDRISAFLARCDGILYLFDPSAPPDESLEYFNDLMLMLHARIGRSDGRGLIRNRIPQPLAVCFTKYDDGPVFNRLRENGRIVLEGRDGPGVPTVTDPRAAFADIARRDHVRMIENYFLTVDYFAMSAIGFLAGPDGRYDLSNCSKVYMAMDGSRIQGQVSPIGLLDPLLWLDEEMRKLKG
jgi:hypothetical protein